MRGAPFVHVACLAALMATGAFVTPAQAALPQCPDGQGVYQAVSGPPHEVVFQGEKGTLTLAKGQARVRYPFQVTYSNGFARTYLNVAGKGAPSSVVMAFNPDFSPYRGEGSAPYLVTPDLPVGFHYWEPFRSRLDAFDLLPGDAWHLVRCSTGQR